MFLSLLSSLCLSSLSWTAGFQYQCSSRLIILLLLIRKRIIFTWDKFLKNVLTLLLLIFVNVTLTYVMIVRMVHERIRKLKCFPDNNVQKIKLLIRRKIGTLVSLSSP